MRMVLLFVVVLLVTGCGNSRPQKLPWPAHISSIDGFTEEQRTLIVEDIERLNKSAGKTVVSLDEASKGYPIFIRRVEPNEQHKTRVGYAIVRSDNCNIEISSALFSSEKIDMLPSVVLHELFHCGGGKHVEESGEVMSKTTQPFQYFSTESLDRFFTSFLHLVSL